MEVCQKLEVSNLKNQCCGSGSVWIRFNWPDPDPGGAKNLGENAKFLLNIQGFEYSRRFFGRQRKSTKFFFPKKAKKFRNFDFLSRFGQDPDP